MTLKAISLQSGSDGNCIYIETESTRLLFDAGLSGIECQRRLAAHGRDIRSVDAVIISHDHADHVRHAGVLNRKYRLPIYITPDTLDTALARHKLGHISEAAHFHAGDEIAIGDIIIRTIPTPHDGVDGAVFVVEHGCKRLGIMTDLGHVFSDLRAELAGLDAVFLESNYDPRMLEFGPYPAFLKKRITGLAGHISNEESAELLLSAERLQWACLSHLSHHNNYPSLALKTHRKIIGEELTLHVAPRNSSGEVLEL